MFDFALSTNRRRRPTGRFCVSVAASCVLHLLLVVVLVENPWLFRGGMYPHFRGLILFPEYSESPDAPDDGEYRTVAVLRPMELPPYDVLRGLIYDWDNPPERNADTRRTEVRWGSGQEDAPDVDVRLTAEAAPETPAGSEDASDLAEVPGTGSRPGEGESAPAVPEPEPAAEAVTPLEGPPPGEEALALDTAPARIPVAPPAAEEEGIRTFDTMDQAIRGSGSGIFDHQGFPLDEYASRIRQRVTSNWYIPSNLRESNGYTTIIFYIDREGNNFDARIVDSSGNNSLNMTALNAIIQSDPFPPLPEGFPGKHIGVKYIFIPDPR